MEGGAKEGYWVEIDIPSKKNEAKKGEVQPEVIELLTVSRDIVIFKDYLQREAMIIQLD